MGTPSNDLCLFSSATCLPPTHTRGVDMNQVQRCFWSVKSIRGLARVKWPSQWQRGGAPRKISSHKSTSLERSPFLPQNRDGVLQEDEWMLDVIQGAAPMADTAPPTPLEKCSHQEGRMPKGMDRGGFSLGWGCPSCNKPSSTEKTGIAWYLLLSRLVFIRRVLPEPRLDSKCNKGGADAGCKVTPDDGVIYAVHKNSYWVINHLFTAVFCVTFGCTAKSIILYILISIPFQILFPERLLHSMESITPCYTVGPSYLLYIQ